MTESTKDALFRSCAEKTCCTSYTVFLSGLDVWRIATALHVPPWAFTTPVPSNDAPDAMMLDNSGQRYRVALRKVAARGKRLPACVFLTRLADGFPRCGLDELRPDACRSFPAFLANGLLCVTNDGGCTCRTWSLADLDISDETARVREEMTARELYHRVVASWNAYVRRAAGDEHWAYQDFCRYLLDVYTQLDSERPEETRAR